MLIGYACQVMDAADYKLKSCTQKTATPQKLTELIAHNLSVLDRMLDYNIVSGIQLFRISSDIIPFGSSPVNTVDWESLFQRELRLLGEKAQNHGMRLSMHPGQYTVLNSPHPQTVLGAVADLRYHAKFLDALGLGPQHKLILHIGGGYGDKVEAARRFSGNYRQLEDPIQNRLVLENDDRIYTIQEVWEIAQALSIPVVMDVLHHRVNAANGAVTEAQWLERSRHTWQARDGLQKIHYAQQAAGKKPGSHSGTIAVEEFARFHRGLEADVDIMLEVKDKNLSAVKCNYCVADSVPVKHLEREWSRYKYAVLERGPTEYLEIRGLLKDKAGTLALPFYRLVEAALARPLTPGNSLNAAQHVWGHFRKTASPREKQQFHALAEGLQQGLPSRRMRRFLWRMAGKYQEPYLLQSHYFICGD